jgi:hypothetical protein
VRDYRWQLVRLSDGIKVAARHRFGARAIVSRWTVSCTRRRGRDDVAAADLPAYGPPGDLATVRLQSDPSGGYRLIPAGIAASRRAADPLAGPTLTVRWTGRLESRQDRLAVKLAPFR